MHSGVKRVAATTTATLLAVLGLGSGIASADDTPTNTPVVIQTDPPQETDPADTGLVDVPADQVNAEPDIPGSGDSGSGNHPGGQICDRATVYIPNSKGKDYHKGIGAPRRTTMQPTTPPNRPSARKPREPLGCRSADTCPPASMR